MRDWPDPARAIVFLDFDGTLVDIAATPEAVVIPPDLPDLLAGLQKVTGGNTILLSGRDVQTLQGFLPSFRGRIIGCHGAEVWDGTACSVLAIDKAALAQAISAARHSEMAGNGVRIEEKPTGLVLHYRAHPELEREALTLAETLVSGLSDYQVLPGKMAVEVRPTKVGKESAIRETLVMSEFTGKTPMFFGDDTTDLAGLHHVARVGGVAGYIGSEVDGMTAIFDTPTSLRARLEMWITEHWNV